MPGVPLCQLDDRSDMLQETLKIDENFPIHIHFAENLLRYIAHNHHPTTVFALVVVAGLSLSQFFSSSPEHPEEIVSLEDLFETARQKALELQADPDSRWNSINAN